MREQQCKDQVRSREEEEMVFPVFLKMQRKVCIVLENTYRSCRGSGISIPKSTWMGG